MAGYKKHFYLENLQVYNCLTETGQDPSRNIFSYFNYRTYKLGRNPVRPDRRSTFILKIYKYTTALQKLERIRVEKYFFYTSGSKCQLGTRQGPIKEALSSLKFTNIQLPYRNQIGSEQKHIFVFQLQDPYDSQEPGRAGYKKHFYLENFQVDN